MSLFGVLAAMARSSKICIILPGLKATSCLTVVLLVCLETVLLSTVSNCAKTFYVHWNTTNSIFRIDNTDHIIDVNKGNLQFEYDQVNIICPVYSPGSFDEDAEKYIIYNVSKEEYDTCRITNPNPRIIAICDKPHKLMYFTITFRPFTPQPGGLEFLPGNDYYFISTSSKDDLHRRIGGRCSTHNMKVVFKVCCPVEEPISTSAIPQIKIIVPHSTPSGMIGHYRPSTSAVSWPTWSSSQSVARGTVAPPSTDKIVPAHKPPLKKTTDEFDKHPNEVVKNEELTYSGTATSINYTTWINVVAAIVIIRWR